MYDNPTSKKRFDKEHFDGWLVICIGVIAIVFGLFILITGWINQDTDMQDSGFWVMLGGAAACATGFITRTRHL